MTMRNQKCEMLKSSAFGGGRPHCKRTVLPHPLKKGRIGQNKACQKA